MPMRCGDRGAMSMMGSRDEGRLGPRDAAGMAMRAMALAVAVAMASVAAPPVAARADIVTDIEEARGRCDELYAEAEVANEELNETNQRLADLDAQIAGIEGDVDSDRRALCKTMVFQYKSGGATTMQAVLNADTFEGLLAGMQYSAQVVEGSRARVRAVNDATRELREARAQLAAAQEEQRVRAEELDARVAEANAYMDGLTQELRDELGVDARAEAWGIPDVISSGTGEAWRDVVITAAYANLGGAYVYGGEALRANDCSGLVKWCYAQIGVYVGHSSEIQVAYCDKPISEALPGDIVYRYGHVGVYIGDGTTIEAHSPGRGISYGSLYSFVACGSPCD